MQPAFIIAKRVRPCRIWANNRHFLSSLRCPLYPQKRTLRGEGCPRILVPIAPLLFVGDRLDQDARNADSSDSSSTENSTGIISFVVTLPFKSLSTTTSCCASSRPTGITILPPALSWLIRGGGIRSGAAVTITLSNGACIGQPA